MFEKEKETLDEIYRQREENLKWVLTFMERYEKKHARTNKRTGK